MKLSRLLHSIGLRADFREADAYQISSLHYDSRDVAPGGLFVAIKGFTVDGHAFIDDAVRNGAAAIVAEQPVAAGVPVYTVGSARRALASLADAFFGHPTRDLTLVAITGTNGKTTTSYILESILKKAGFNVGVIGTVNYRYNRKVFDNPVTTPESLDLQRIFWEMKKDGVSHVIMEASSHAIDLDRIFRCDIDVAVFTNLSQDHLDYHQDMQTYWECKKRLFTEYLAAGHDSASRVAVINADYPHGRELIEEISDPCVTVGHAPENAVRPLEVVMGLKGISGTLAVHGGTFSFQSGLAGRHNLENMLCAAGAAAALNIAAETIQAGIEGVSFVPGRLQRVPGSAERPVFVDYAHTPDALENVLLALKSLGSERLICIFGCGGDRDRAKRPMMGEIAGRLSDLAVVTSDNPRTEQPAAIIADILPGLKAAGSLEFRPAEIRNGWQNKGFLVEPDRKQAIRLGIQASRKGDIVVIAGKGHETYQIIGEQTLPFDDVAEASKIMEKESKPIPWKTAEILAATGGELMAGPGDRVFDGIAIDSRKIAPSDLFVAIIGEVHDGHTFVDSVLKQGVQGVLVAREWVRNRVPEDVGRPAPTIIGVDDTTLALGALAAFNRDRLPLKVIALTGSNGKTSTRTMLTHIVEQHYHTLVPVGNYNNQIGLPLTLLRLEKNHTLAVLELGMNRPGEIKALADICRPDIGIITNVGPAHLEGLGSIEGILHAKAELLKGLNADGKTILNADDPRVAGLAETAPGEVLLFGLSGNAGIRARRIRQKGHGVSFLLEAPGGSVEVSLATPGKFMVSNALAAAAAGYLMGIPLSDLKAGLERFQPVSGRMQILELANGICLIDDAYNANPFSMKAALDTLQQLAQRRFRIAVLGDMLELGKTSAALHRDVGRHAALTAVERLYLTGDFAGDIARGAMEAGMDAARIVIGSLEEITADLIGRADSRHNVLVKGSRGMRMERIVEELINAFGQG